jgi:hypothetical protein
MIFPDNADARYLGTYYGCKLKNPSQATSQSGPTDSKMQSASICT